MMTLTLILTSRPLVRGDGLAYLVWIDTLVLDQDINLNNQHDRFREVNTYQIEWSFDQERWVNIFPFGIAFVQAPFYLIGDFFHHQGIVSINPDYFQQMQGVGLPYSLLLMFGANLMMLIAAVLAYLLGNRLVDRWTAAIAVYAVFIGTPVFYYSTISPVNSHNAGAFTTACFVYLLATLTDFGSQGAAHHCPTKQAWYLWVLLGVFAALTVMARWQLLMVVAPGWVLLLVERRWRGLVIATIAAGVAILPLPLVWNSMFGAPFVVPFDTVNDDPFMQARNFSWEVLRETVRHSPVVLLSLLGIPAMWRVSRQWAVFLAVVIGLQVFINGAALDWNAGEAYGMRRMSEIYIVYALLVCALAGQVITWGKIHQWRLRPVVQIILVALIAYTVLYIAAFMNFTWTNPEFRFSDRPDVMIRYFFNQDHRYEILWEVYRTHMGPLSWSMPGP